MSYRRLPGPVWVRNGGRKVIHPSEDYMKAITVECPFCHAPSTTPCEGMTDEPNNFHVIRLDTWQKKWK